MRTRQHACAASDKTDRDRQTDRRIARIAFDRQDSTAFLTHARDKTAQTRQTTASHLMRRTHDSISMRRIYARTHRTHGITQHRIYRDAFTARTQTDKYCTHFTYHRTRQSTTKHRDAQTRRRTRQNRQNISVTHRGTFIKTRQTARASRRQTDKTHRISTHLPDKTRRIADKTHGIATASRRDKTDKTDTYQHRQTDKYFARDRRIAFIATHFIATACTPHRDKTDTDRHHQDARMHACDSTHRQTDSIEPVR
jgi:hypothetical protein